MRFERAAWALGLVGALASSGCDLDTLDDILRGRARRGVARLLRALALAGVAAVGWLTDTTEALTGVWTTCSCPDSMPAMMVGSSVVSGNSSR